MTCVIVEELAFEFEAGMEASKYDDWRFYQKHFQKVKVGTKAVDIIALDTSTLFLIEVKDYRTHRREKATDICEEFANKVVDTLAALMPASLKASRESEKSQARKALKRTSIRLVLHIEQHPTKSKLFPQLFKLVDVEQKIKIKLRAIDHRCRAADMKTIGNLPWSVSQRSKNFSGDTN